MYVSDKNGLLYKRADLVEKRLTHTRLTNDFSFLTLKCYDKSAGLKKTSVVQMPSLTLPQECQW